ncbi:MAG: RloB family protein [Chitinophagales bacterium]
MARKTKKRSFKGYNIGLVCEGETEWFYFEHFKTAKKLPYKLKPDLPKHSSYISIFAKAKQLVDDEYDKVFCILDLDDIRSQNLTKKYEKAKATLPKNKKIVVIETMPCFEFWFLLHFINYSTKVYEDWVSLAPVLKKYWPAYEKDQNYFRSVNLYKYITINGNEVNAKELAEKLRKAKAESNNDLFPFTDMDLLLNNLNRLKQSREDKDKHRKST